MDIRKPTLGVCRNQATSTREEARIMVQELKRRGVKKFLLVTSEFHTRRAARVYAAESGARSVPRRGDAHSRIRLERWWTTRDGIKNVYMEWSKAVAYLFDF